MRSVAILSAQADAERMAAALEGAGLEAEVVPPRELRLDEAARAGAYVVDCRDITQGGLRTVIEHGSDQGVTLLVLVPAEMLDRITVDLAVDDFAVLPIEGAELARRVERALWKRHGVDAENVVSCGPLTIDLSNYRVAIDGEVVILTFKEYELLRFLAMNPGQVFTREQLLNRVWGYDYFGGARTVDVHIRRIRAKIETRGRVFIETVRNVGYRMLATPR